MQVALLSLVVISSFAMAAGSVITWVAMRRAPEALEDSTGFHAVSTMGTIEQFPMAHVHSEQLKRAA